MNTELWMAVMGGLCIGTSAVVLLSLAGRIAGVSGILWGALTEQSTHLWRWLFLLGLAVGFLDVAGSWQPALLLVMGSAVMVTFVGFALVRRQKRPLFAPSFHFPVKRAIDGRLLGGAALFGIGWGIYGFCPGPAVTALFYGDVGTYYFFAAMIAGMWIANHLESRRHNA